MELKLFISKKIIANKYKNKKPPYGDQTNTYTNNKIIKVIEIIIPKIKIIIKLFRAKLARRIPKNFLQKYLGI